jgi:hypothetical protein
MLATGTVQIPQIFITEKKKNQTFEMHLVWNNKAMLNFIEFKEKYSEYKMDVCSSLHLCSKHFFFTLVKI